MSNMQNLINQFSSLDQVQWESYGSDVYQRATQMESKLQNQFERRSSPSLEKNWARKTEVEFVEQTAQAERTPITEFNTDTRTLQKRRFHAGIQLGEEYENMAFIDAMSSIQSSLAIGMARKIDLAIIEDLFDQVATQTRGEGGSKLTKGLAPLPNKQKAVLHTSGTIKSFKDMTGDDFLALRRIFLDANVDVGDVICVLCPHSMYDALTKIDDFSNKDKIYVAQPGVEHRREIEWNGFKFIRTSGQILKSPKEANSTALRFTNGSGTNVLGTNTTSATGSSEVSDAKMNAQGVIATPCFIKRAAYLDLEAPYKTRFDEMPANSYDSQVYTKFRCGLVRMEDELVVKLIGNLI